MTMLSSFPLAERAKNRYNNCHIKGGICMPVLKFICPKCKHIYEELVRVGQTAPCPKCGETNVERYYQGKCSFGMLGSSAGYTTTTTEDTQDWKSF